MGREAEGLRAEASASEVRVVGGLGGRERRGPRRAAEVEVVHQGAPRPQGQRLEEGRPVERRGARVVAVEDVDEHAVEGLAVVLQHEVDAVADDDGAARRRGDRGGDGRVQIHGDVRRVRRDGLQKAGQRARAVAEVEEAGRAPVAEDRERERRRGLEVLGVEEPRVAVHDAVVDGPPVREAQADGAPAVAPLPDLERRVLEARRRRRGHERRVLRGPRVPPARERVRVVVRGRVARRAVQDRRDARQLRRPVEPGLARLLGVPELLGVAAGRRREHQALDARVVHEVEPVGRELPDGVVRGRREAVE